MCAKGTSENCVTLIPQAAWRPSQHLTPRVFTDNNSSLPSLYVPALMMYCVSLICTFLSHIATF